MDVILDYDLQTKRGMMKQCDQQEDHAAGCKRSPDPGNEGQVIASGMSDHRGDEPQAQRYKRDCCEAFRPPVPEATSGRPEPKGASQRRAEGSPAHWGHLATNTLVTHAATVSAALDPTTVHP